MYILGFMNSVQNNSSVILKKLTDVGVKAVCPMCGNNHFVLGDGIVPFFIQDSLGSINIGPKTAPAIFIVCDKCGFISYHSAVVLGIVDFLKEEAGEKK